MDTDLASVEVGRLEELARKSAATIAKAVDTITFPKIDVESLALAVQRYSSSLPAIIDAVGSAYKALETIRPTYLSVIEELRISSFTSMLENDLEAPVYFMPQRSPARETRITIHTQTLNINMGERETVMPPPPLPEPECMELDTFIALKPGNDGQGIWYVKNRQWRFAHLPPLAVNILLYLYQMRLSPQSYAKRVKDIAAAMNKSPQSISRELSRMKSLCIDLDIKSVISQTSEKRWCLNLHLDCCRELRNKMN